jgi:hypothetical protein
MLEGRNFVCRLPRGESAGSSFSSSFAFEVTLTSGAFSDGIGVMQTCRPDRTSSSRSGRILVTTRMLLALEGLGDRNIASLAVFAVVGGENTASASREADCSGVAVATIMVMVPLVG